MTAFSETDDDDTSDYSGEATSVMKECFQVLDDLAHCFFEADHFLGRCLSFTRNMEVVMSPHREECKDIQKKAR